MRKHAMVLMMGAAFLAGCDGKASPAGAGVSSGDEERSVVGEHLDRLKELSVARQKGLVQTTPLVGLVITAAQDLRPTYHGEQNDFLDRAACAIGLDGKEQAEAVRILRESDGIDTDTIPQAGHELSVIVHGTQDENNAACVAYFLAGAVAPATGWPVSGDFLSFDPAVQAQNAQGAITYARQRYFMVEAATQILQPVVTELARKTGYSVQELGAEARRLLVANAKRDRQILVEQQGAMNSMQIQRDGTGSSAAPVHYWVTNQGADVAIDGSGPTVTKNGAPWFGQGYLAGTSYSVEAITTSGATLTRSARSITSAENALTKSTTAQARTQ
ncbi:hypothetical protein ACTXY8_30700 [Pseudomonas aeruginosa]